MIKLLDSINKTISFFVVYYDVNPKARDGIIELLLNFTTNVFSPRLWEIRILQVPFSKRAPTGCLQYFTESEGTLSTFNFAENGRHLANQNYNTCFQQQSGMCSIAYEPCNDQSFRIGPSENTPLGSGDLVPQEPGEIVGGPPTDIASNPIATDDLAAAGSEDNEVLADDAIEEGSGAGGFPSFSSIRDLFFSFRGMRARKGRQLYSTCTDRITMPCIIEDFIGVGLGDVPSCVPVHCGLSLCAPGVTPCRLETSVTPFRLGVRFGQGVGKGSPEDNIGACLRFTQVPCAT